MKRFKYGVVGLFAVGILFSGCATIRVPKRDVVQMFRMCGEGRLFALTDSVVRACTDASVATFGPRSLGIIPKDSSLRLVVQYQMNFGSKIHFRDRDQVRRRVNVDQNTSLVLFDSLENTDRLYLANSTILFGNCISGAKSRLLGWDISCKLEDVHETGIYDEAPFNYFREVEPSGDRIDEPTLASVEEAFGRSDSATFAFRNVMCDEDTSCLLAKLEHSNRSTVKFTISKRSTLDSVGDYIRDSGPFLSADSMPCIGRTVPFGVVSFHGARPYPDIVFNLNRRYLSIGNKSALAGRNIANHIFPLVANAWRASFVTSKRQP